MGHEPFYGSSMSDVLFPSQIGHMPGLHLSYLTVNIGIFSRLKRSLTMQRLRASPEQSKNDFKIPHWSVGRGPV